jgi:cytochrome c peroxidase
MKHILISMFSTLTLGVISAAVLFAATATTAQADVPQNMLAMFQEQSGVKGSASRGERLFFARRTHSNGETVSCTTCHTENPKAKGKTRANKLIEPIAPVANKERFSDPAKVEKWFKRNCRDVLERACTEQEKADFIAFMLSVR